MTTKGTKGLKNRNYPGVSLEQALVIPRAIQDDAAGNSVSRITLAELVGRSPGSSAFIELVMASRSYGLTEGGANAPEFSLTERGARATGIDDSDKTVALREAVLSVPPYGIFLRSNDGKRVPSAAPFREFLINKCTVPDSRADECKKLLLEDARFVGFVRTVKGAEWIELNGIHPKIHNGSESLVESSAFEPVALDAEDHQTEPMVLAGVSESKNGHTDVSNGKNKVFIAHGKNRGPLEQLQKMLDQFKVPYLVAVNEPHAGRPISAQVAHLMEECSAGIFIFTADEHFLKEDGSGGTQNIYRPSENVVYELGAASILYGRRIVIFKEESVTFPSDFSDLGHISFKSDQLDSRLGDLLHELVGLELLEVRVKS